MGAVMRILKHPVAIGVIGYIVLSVVDARTGGKVSQLINKVPGYKTLTGVA